MKRFYFLFLISAIFLPSVGQGQEKPPLEAAARALSVYPASLRAASQKVLASPATLAKLGSIQKQSRGDFNKLLSTLKPEEQKQLWQIVRYPRLLQGLVALGPSGDTKQLVSNYPKESQAAAKALLKNQLDLLKKCEEIGNRAKAEFSSAIQGLPPPTQEAFRSVAGHSEILLIMSQALGLSSVDPESFRKNPQPLTRDSKKLAALIASAPTSTPTQPIPSQAGDDPEALARLQKAEQNFKAQNDYELDQDPHPKGAVQVNVGYTPDSSLFTPIGWAYPFWFGWPAWDPFPYW